MKLFNVGVNKLNANDLPNFGSYFYKQKITENCQNMLLTMQKFNFA